MHLALLRIPATLREELRLVIGILQVLRQGRPRLRRLLLDFLSLHLIIVHPDFAELAAQAFQLSQFAVSVLGRARRSVPARQEMRLVVEKQLAVVSDFIVQLDRGGQMLVDALDEGLLV